MKYQANVIYRTDDRGEPVACIELSNRPGLFVTMDRADWDQWLADGRSQSLYSNSIRPWKWTVAYSDRLNGRVGYATNAARAIMQPPLGFVAARRSGDPLDLRRSNLRLITRRERRKIGGW